MVWINKLCRKLLCSCSIGAKSFEQSWNNKQLIYTTDKSHYWNLVYENGSWWHYDATPGGHVLGPVKDEEKLNSSSMQGRKWSDSFPKAE